MQDKVKEVLASIDSIRIKAVGLPSALHHEIETKNQIMDGLALLKRQVLELAEKGEKGCS